MKSFGYIPSVITWKTPKYKPAASKPLPRKYTYRPFLSPVTNQGTDPYCIPHSIACWLNWRENTKTGVKTDNHIKYQDIYRYKKISGEGMTYEEAFECLKKRGVKSDKGVLKISQAGYVPNLIALKMAILANGPCFGALPVYDPDADQFWKRNGSKVQAWHSVAIVGWNEEGYVIRNSWGVGYGDKGYMTVPYADASSFKEIWTILA